MILYREDYYALLNRLSRVSFNEYVFKPAFDPETLPSKEEELERVLTSLPTNFSPTRTQQFRAIISAIQNQRWDRMSIPYRGKGTLKKALKPVFGANGWSFDEAWKAGVAMDLWRTANHDESSGRHK